LSVVVTCRSIAYRNLPSLLLVRVRYIVCCLSLNIDGFIVSTLPYKLRI